MSRAGIARMGREQGRVEAAGVGEHAQGSRVQPRPSYGTEAAVGGLADQVVPEPDHAALVCSEQIRGQGRIEPLVDVGEVELGQLRDAGRVDGGPEHRGDQQHVLAGGGKARHPGAEDIGDGGGYDVQR